MDHKEAYKIYQECLNMNLTEMLELIARTESDEEKSSVLRNIPFSPPDVTELEIAEVAEALRSGWITTGPRTKELERRLANYIGTSNEAVNTLAG